MKYVYRFGAFVIITGLAYCVGFTVISHVGPFVVRAVCR